MRTFIASAVASFAVIACSSSAGEGEACDVVGTYVTTDAKQSGSCPDVGSQPTTWTISSDGAGGYVVETAGIKGGCTAQPVNACKVQGKCDVIVADPIDPAKNQGTIQYSWTFKDGGFTGSTVIFAPASAALKDGCSSEYVSTGVRR